MVNSISRTFYLATPYAFGVALVYLLGYWSTFDINILEYISISDVIKISVYPIVISTFFTVFGFVLGQFSSPEKPFPFPRTEHDKRLQCHQKYFNLCVLAFLGIISIISDIAHIWYVGCVLLLLMIEDAISLFIDVDKLFPNVNRNVISILCSSIIALPLFSFAYGKINAHHTLIGHNTRFVKTSVFKDKDLFDNDKKLKFLGMTGNYMIFLSEDNSRCFISRSDQIPILELSKPSYIETNLLRKWIK